MIQLRFGLLDGHPRTLEEVGREFGVARERIRQIESKTLSKLRHPSRSQSSGITWSDGGKVARTRGPTATRPLPLVVVPVGVAPGGEPVLDLHAGPLDGSQAHHPGPIGERTAAIGQLPDGRLLEAASVTCKVRVASW